MTVRFKDHLVISCVYIIPSCTQCYRTAGSRNLAAWNFLEVYTIYRTCQRDLVISNFFTMQKGIHSIRQRKVELYNEEGPPVRRQKMVTCVTRARENYHLTFEMTGMMKWMQVKSHSDEFKHHHDHASIAVLIPPMWFGYSRKQCIVLPWHVDVVGRGLLTQRVQFLKVRQLTIDWK